MGRPLAAANRMPRLCQSADSLRKVRRELALVVQQSGVKVGGNEADDVHARLLSPHS